MWYKKQLIGVANAKKKRICLNGKKKLRFYYRLAVYFLSILSDGRQINPNTITMTNSKVWFQITLHHILKHFALFLYFPKNWIWYPFNWYYVTIVLSWIRSKNRTFNGSPSIESKKTKKEDSIDENFHWNKNKNIKEREWERMREKREKTNFYINHVYKGDVISFNIIMIRIFFFSFSFLFAIYTFLYSMVDYVFKRLYTYTRLPRPVYKIETGKRINISEQ